MWTRTHHVWQAYVRQAADQGATQTRQLHEQSLVLLLDHLVLVLDALQVLFHGGDLQHKQQPVLVLHQQHQESTAECLLPARQEGGLQRHPELLQDKYWTFRRS